MGEMEHFIEPSRKAIGLIKWLETAEYWWAQQDSNLRHADYELFQEVFCLVLLSAAWFGSVGFFKPFL